MRKRDLDKFKKILLMERQEILGQLLKIEKDSDSHLSQLGGDSADIASIEISQAALSKLGGREQKYLKKIDHALKKIEDGTYGLCELTGEPIPIKRLEARPVAQYTVEAKQELEQRERQYRDSDESDEDFGSNDFDDVE